MRKLLTLTFLMLACGLWAFAQQSYPSQSNQSNQSQTSNSNQTSIQGCLSGSSGNYTLTADSGTKYQLSGDTSKLSDHVGHEVEITGTTTSSTASNSGASSSNVGSSSSNTSGSSSAPTLDVTKVKHISTTCSSSSGSMQH